MSRLGELTIVITRGAAPHYVDTGGVAVLNQKCIRNEHVSYDNARRTDHVHRAIRADRWLRPFDVLVNSTGVGTLGRVAQIVHVPEPTTVDSHVTIVRPDPDAVDPYFLGFVLRGIQTEIESHATGSTGQTELSPDSLRNLTLDLPPLSEQRAIAEILGALDDKIEVNGRMNATLDAMARALFKSWFVDFDPVRAKVEGRAPSHMDSPTAALFPASFEDSSMGPIPSGWAAGTVDDLIEINPARGLKAGAVAPYVDMASLPTSGSAISEIGPRLFKSGSRFERDDTLFARITPCTENGKTAYVDCLDDGVVGWGSTEFIVMRPKPPLPAPFAYTLARDSSFREHAITNMSGTSGRQRVPADAVKRYPICIPPASIAEAWGGLVEPWFAMVRAATSESRTLAELRDTLLPRLISGEIRVGDAAREVEVAV